MSKPDLSKYNKYLTYSADELEKIVDDYDEKIHNLLFSAPTYDDYVIESKEMWDDRFFADEAYKHINTNIRISDYTELDLECKMTLDEFKSSCKCGFLTSNDGFGYYANDKGVTNIYASPRAFCYDINLTEYPYVCWFNK